MINENDNNRKGYIALLSDADVKEKLALIEATRVYHTINNNQKQRYYDKEGKCCRTYIPKLFQIKAVRIFGKNIIMNEVTKSRWFDSNDGSSSSSSSSSSGPLQFQRLI